MSIFNKSDSGLTILCDVGSGSMTVSLVLYSKSSQPTFLYTLTKGFTVPDKPDSFKLVDNMLSSLDELILKVVDESSVHSKKTKDSNEVQNVVLSFSSPWFLPKTKQIEIKEEKPFVITEAYLKKILNQEEENFKKEIRESSENKEGDFEIIENSIVHVKVNGYVISKIIGQRVSSFSAYFCMSLISKDVWDKIHTIVQKHTHLDMEKIILHTFPVVSFTVLRDMFSDFQDFILMDVTSEATDLTLVSNDVLVKTSTIPLGRNYLIRQIAKQFSVPSEIAESNLSLYSSQKLLSETSDKIQDILIDIEKEWAVYFEKALLDLAPELNLPTRVYLTSQDDVSNIFVDFTKLSKADVTSKFRKNINLLRIENSTLQTFYKNQSHTEPNEFICLLAIFWNKFVFKK